MLVRMVVDVVAGFGAVLHEDTVHDVDDRFGAELCAHGRAVEVAHDPPIAEQAVGVPQRPQARRQKER